MHIRYIQTPGSGQWPKTARDISWLNCYLEPSQEKERPLLTDSGAFMRSVGVGMSMCIWAPTNQFTFSHKTWPLLHFVFIRLVLDPLGSWSCLGTGLTPPPPPPPCSRLQNSVIIPTQIQCLRGFRVYSWCLLDFLLPSPKRWSSVFSADVVRRP